MYPREFLLSLLWIPSERLSTRLDNVLDVNLRLLNKIKFILYFVFVSALKKLYFLVLSLSPSKCPLSSSASLLIIKWSKTILMPCILNYKHYEMRLYILQCNDSDLWLHSIFYFHYQHKRFVYITSILIMIWMIFFICSWYYFFFILL